MSINSLANAATARRPDFPPLQTVPADMGEIATAANATPPQDGKVPPEGQPALAGRRVDTALHVLFGYIPTEVLTLYVAVVATFPEDGNVAMNAKWTAFFCFLIATPIILWLVYAAKLKGENKQLPLRWDTWPVWEMIAATLAFTAWAYAMPGSPLGRAWPGLSRLAVLFVSTLLGLLAPLFQRPLHTL